MVIYADAVLPAAPWLISPAVAFASAPPGARTQASAIWMEEPGPELAAAVGVGLAGDGATLHAARAHAHVARTSRLRRRIMWLPDG
jgi:hypothetical protein